MTPVLTPEALNSVCLKVLTIQRVTAGRWWNFRHVISPFSRLWLVLGGRATVWHHGRRFILRPGQVHLVPPFTVHDCSCASRLDHYYVHFIAPIPTGIDLFSVVDCEYQMAATAAMAGYLRQLEQIYPGRKLQCFDPRRKEYGRLPALAESPATPAEALDEFEAGGLLRLLLAPFLRQAHVQEGIHARVSRQFVAVQEFIHANMRQRILLPDLAKVVDLHPTYFSDQFERIVGIRPLEYLMRRRMERAQYLLLASRASVKEIADAVGFRDVAYFSRAFSRLCHVSPSQYRAAHAG